ncbi:MAG: hypothetical protein ACYTE0_10245 [Planctomycetota bacterium]|jgi:hypothetical protein
MWLSNHAVAGVEKRCHTVTPRHRHSATEVSAFATDKKPDSIEITNAIDSTRRTWSLSRIPSAENPLNSLFDLSCGEYLKLCNVNMPSPVRRQKLPANLKMNSLLQVSKKPFLTMAG